MRKQAGLYALVLIATAVAFVSPDRSIAAETLSPKQRITLLASCAAVQATDARALTYIFKFDVHEVQTGSFGDAQVVFAMRSDGGGRDLLEVVEGDPKNKKVTCSDQHRYELTVMVPPPNPHFADYGVNSMLQEWKRTEKTDE